MDTRNVLDARGHARGSARPIFLAALGVIVLLVIGAWFLIIKPHQALMMTDAGGHPPLPISNATQAAPPPAEVAAMDNNQLLAEARKAMNEQRYLAPKGNNAFEFYLRVLEKQPGNRVASDALRETFPFAASSAEQAINSRDFNEAQRQIDLLAKADPANFTLTILRSKLDAQRKLLDKQQQQVVDQEKAQQVAAQKTSADRLAADKLAEQEKAQQVEQQKTQRARPPQPPRQQAAAAKPAGEENAPAGGSGAPSSDAVLLKGVDPIYPTGALRAHQSGWVVVSFTIDPSGSTSDVRVVNSQPGRVFNRAALDAVARYRFTPAMKDGVAVPSTRQQKIEFNL